MADCSSCGNEITEGVSFCSHCGASQQQAGTQATPRQPARKPRRMNRFLKWGGIAVVGIVILLIVVAALAPPTGYEVENGSNRATERMEENFALLEAERQATIQGTVKETATSTSIPTLPLSGGPNERQPESTLPIIADIFADILPGIERDETMLSRDTCALFAMAAPAIGSLGVNASKQFADKYAPGMTMELVLWQYERLDTIPTYTLDIHNFAKMLALVREGAISGIELGDYHTLRSRYNDLGRWPHNITDADAIAMEILGSEIPLDERFGKVDITNRQIQIDQQMELSIADCANLGKLAPVSVVFPLPIAGFVSGKCDRAILFYSDRMEILTPTGTIGGETRGVLFLSFRDPQLDTYEPRLIATLQEAGESIVERCERP